MIMPATAAGAPTRAARRRLVRGAFVGLSASIVALALWYSGALAAFEYRTWDWRARLLAPSIEPSRNVVQVYIDEYSLGHLRESSGISWPWPREAYALLTRFFERAGAKVVAFDIIFSDPSFAGVHDDRAFATAMESAGNVVSAVFLGDEEGGVGKWPEGVPEPDLPGVSADGGEVLGRHASSSRGALFPDDELVGSSRTLGNVNMVADADGVYRRGRLFTAFDGRLLPSLGAAAFIVGSGEEGGFEVREGRLTARGSVIPMDRRGYVLLRWPDQERVRSYSAAAIIQSELRLMEGREPTLNPERFEDAYVLVGASARGLYDLRPTPLRPRAPGVTFHATLLDNLLRGGFMRELAAFPFVLLTLLLVLPAAVLAAFVSGPYRSASLYFVLLPLPVAVSTGAYAVGISFSMLPLMAGVALALVSSNVLSYAIEGRQKRYIKNAFQQYPSPTVIEQLLAHPERLRLGGERRDLTIFFSDLEGFTSISEGLSPEELTALLNDYLSAMTDIIREEGGTIDKYEGDAIIAFWNAPLAQPDHALRGVRAAVRCQLELARLRPELRRRAGRDLFMRIGMNSGPAVVGNMGSRTRFDYTMLGDSVNLAARLEGINKQFGTYTLITQATADLLDGAFPVREVSRVAVVGRKEAVTIYEPFDRGRYEARRAGLEAFEEALRLYYSGDFEAAATAFARLEGEDPVAAVYRLRSEELAGSPPAAWEGVWVMTAK